MKVKVKEIVSGCFPIRSNGNKSDCFDLYLAEDVSLKKGELSIVKLGVAMQLPKGFIARVYSRSSTPVKLGIGVANGLGFIDNSYHGDNDEWRCVIVAYTDCIIAAGSRICQFEVVPSQFATWYQKLKWLFGKVYLQKVECLENKDRGGIGTSGIK